MTNKRGRLQEGTKVVVMDAGPNYGRPAKVERAMETSAAGGYLIRFIGEREIRTALHIELLP